MKLLSTLSLITAGVTCSSMVQGKQEGREMIQKNSIENESKTNVILIMTDDMGVEALGCYGGLSYDTPNLDQMAEQGKLFTHCYSQPLSTPSRVKLMTGKYNYKNYVAFEYLNPEEQTFGNVMKQAGYATSIVGKWQLNGIHGFRTSKNHWPGWKERDRPKNFGFKEYCLWQLTERHKRYADPFIEQNGKILKGLENSYGPDVFCDYALDFIERKQEQDQPFFLYYPMVLPHSPFVPTPDSEEWKDKDKRYESEKRYFKDMVEYTDKLVGKIIQKVKDLGIAENTLIIFTSDNGTNQSIVSQTRIGPYRGGKARTIDAGTHVPLIAYWPGHIKTGSIHEGLIEFSDFFPTFAEIAGVNVQSDGVSFLPLLKGESYKDRETVFVHYDPMRPKNSSANKNRNRFVRNTEYKLYQDGGFYHIPTDKREQNPIKMEHVSWEVIKIRKKLQDILDQAPEWKGKNQ